MGLVIEEVLRNWSGGVNTSLRPDALPPDTSPHGKNSALTSLGASNAVVQKRLGCFTVNRTSITSDPVVIGQYQYKRLNSGSLDSFHLLVSDEGRLDVLGTSTTAAADSGLAAPFSGDPDGLPDFATAANLCFIVNGTDAYKYNGTNVQKFGIVRPASAPTLATGAAGTPSGTYEARVTYYNANTGHESSAGSTSSTVTVSSQKIEFSSIPTSADAQVTARRLYLRNTATMASFYLAATIADNATTTYSYNQADTLLVTVGPDTAENEPPPTGIKYLAWFGNRMFAADTSNIYYSKLNLPEAFDPDNYEPIGPNDGDVITGLHAAHGILIIFKRKSIYVIDTVDPTTWDIRQVVKNIGAVAHRSIFTAGGVTWFWDPLHGPQAWPGATGYPVPIGKQRIEPTISPSTLAFSQLSNVCGAADPTNTRVLWAVPELSKTRNTRILPYNYRLEAWESDQWNVVDVASMASVDDANLDPYVYLGSYSGQVFKFWSGGNDGIAGGTSSGTITSATTSVVTVSGATFDTTGNGLVDRYAYLIDPAGTSIQRCRITANTGTTFTVTPNISGTVDGYTFKLGTIDFEWDTGWRDGDMPFHKKRMEFLFFQAASSTGAATVYADLYLDFDTTTPVRTFSFQTAGSGGTWDSSTWDDYVWGSPQVVDARKRVGRTGKVWRVRFRNRDLDTNVTFYKTGARSERLTSKT